MNPRTAGPSIVMAAAVMVALVAGSSPAAHPIADVGSVDLLASAHPTSAQPALTDTAFGQSRLRGLAVDADTAALTSTTCDGCVGESIALHVLYVPRAGRVSVDNVATAWAQECEGCTSTALSVQVVVLGGRPTAVPTNRALSLTAACTGCRTSSLAFQVVLVADRAVPLSAVELDELRAWVDEQAAALRASVTGPLPDPPISTATPTPTAEPTATGESPTTPTSTQDIGVARRAQASVRRMRRDAASALTELEALLAAALHAEPVSADLEVGS